MDGCWWRIDFHACIVVVRMGEDLGEGKDCWEVEEDGDEEAEEHHFDRGNGSIGEDGWYGSVHYWYEDFERRREREREDDDIKGIVRLLYLLRHYGDLNSGI